MDSHLLISLVLHAKARSPVRPRLPPSFRLFNTTCAVSLSSNSDNPEDKETEVKEEFSGEKNVFFGKCVA